jgi:VWFA-related protein
MTKYIYWRIGCAFIGLLLFASSYSILYPGAKNNKDSHISNAIFRLPINIIRVNATVTDKFGNPVTDLTAKDFKVYDDGNLQEIQTFALEPYGPHEADTDKYEPKAAAQTIPIGRDSPHSRLISIIIDDLTMYSGADLPPIVEAIKQYIEKEIGPNDRVSVLSGSGNVQLPFSRDKRQLLDELSLALGKLNYLPILRAGTDLKAWRLSDPAHAWSMIYKRLESEKMREARDRGEAENRLNAFSTLMDWSTQNQMAERQTLRLLYTIRQNIRTLGRFEGAKMIVLFSDGFLAENETPAAHKLQDIIDLALRSGIVLNSVSFRSLLLDMELGLDLGDKDLQEDTLLQEGPLSQIANDTGGVFIHNRNDFYKGLQEISNRHGYHYILTYGMLSQNSDSSYHHIRLEVSRPNLELFYRKGYSTAQEEMTFENSKKEDIIEALHSPGNMSQIPIVLSYDYLQEEDSRFAVTFVTKVNIRNIRFMEEDNRLKNQISLILAAFDESDHYISGVEKSIDFQLHESSYAALRDHGLTSKVELKLPIGRYKIRAVVRESSQGKMGSINQAVQIP